MDDLHNVARREAERVLGTVAQTRLGTITSFDPDRYAVKLALQPEGIETGWVPLASPWVGQGWGCFAPPALGDQVVVHAQEGEGETRIAAERLYSDEDRPLPVPSGEFWLVHRSGAKVRLLNDGSVEILAPNVRIGPDGATWRRLVNDGFQALFNAHTHPGGGPPSPQMHDGFLTEGLKGG